MLAEQAGRISETSNGKAIQAAWKGRLPLMTFPAYFTRS
jgi:hypothetical protein